MRVLVVASFNKGRFAPFIVEQAEALSKQGCEIDYYGLQGRGIKGYLRNLPQLKNKIREFGPDIIHAHYGLSGLFANLQRKIPVVTTYHGSDINEKKLFRLSKLAMCLSVWNIFVSQRTLAIAKPAKKYSLLPCGVDFSDLQLTDKGEARRKMHLDAGKHYILFAGAFDNEVKNYELAQKTIEELHDPNVRLLELKGYTREEVALLMCAADAFLMTSHSEGSPQVVKEAMACGCPIVSVDVGDVKERIAGVEGCIVSNSKDPAELAALLNKTASYKDKTKGRAKLVTDGLDNLLVAKKLMGIFEEVARINTNVC